MADKQELRKTAEYALETLNKSGADGAEVTLSSGRTDEINVDAGEFSLMRTTFNSSFNVRALIGGRKGVSNVNGIDRDSIDKAAQAALDAAKSSEPDEAEIIAAGLGESSFEYGAGQLDLDLFYDRFSEFMETVKNEYPKVVIGQAVAVYDTVNSVYANSNGSVFFTNQALYNFDVMFAARDGDKSSSFNGYGFTLDKLNRKFIEIADMRRLLEEAEKQIDTIPVEGKFTGKLLVSPDCLIDFLNSIFGNCLKDGALIAGDSPWKDKLGETVAHPSLSVSSDPLNPALIGYSRHTGDGYISGKHDIISGGKLSAFILSQYGAKKTGRNRAGNYDGAYIIAPGDKTFNELLSGIDEGLLINRFSGGDPATNGDFSGVAKNSFLIKNGKVTDAVSETMISGNLLDMLNNISGISRELICDGKTQKPWMVFDGVTVSGK